MRHDDPDREYHSTTGDVARRVEITGAAAKNLAFRNNGRIFPRIKVRETKKNRDKQDCQRRQSAYCRFQESTDAITPVTAREMMSHQQPERAKRESEKELVAKEVCGKEIGRGNNPACDAA